MKAVKSWIVPGFSSSVFVALTALVLTYSPAGATDPCDVVCRSWERCEEEDEGCSAISVLEYCWGTHSTCEEDPWCDDTECS